MNKRLRTMLAGILLLCAMVLVLPAQLLVSMAASGNITFSDPSAAVGEEVTVNMKVSTADGSLSSADIMLAYDATALEFISGNSVDGGAGSLRARGGPDASDLSYIVFSMQFRTLKAGSSQITITSQEVYDINAQTVTINHLGTATVTVVDSSGDVAGDGLLTSLSISPGTLSPAFSSSVDSYSAAVGLDVDSIEVTAVPVDGATVSIEGSDGLQMGENTVTIRVTAADGVTVKTYTISVTKSEEGDAETSETEEVQGVSLEAAAKAITILEPEDGVTLPDGFVETTIDIDGHKVTGWIWADEEEHQYCIFYAMNAAGEKNFYRYDLTEKTIQRYFETDGTGVVTQEEYTALAEDYNSLLQDYQIRFYIVIALIAVSVVLLILVIVLLSSRKTPAAGAAGAAEKPEPARPAVRTAERTVSREEQYLRDEEIEEGPQVLRDGTLTEEGPQALRTGTPGTEEPEDLPLSDDFEEIVTEEIDPVQPEAEAPQPENKARTEAENADDDDFAFIDIDL